MLVTSAIRFNAGPLGRSSECRPSAHLLTFANVSSGEAQYLGVATYGRLVPTHFHRRRASLGTVPRP